MKHVMWWFAASIIAVNPLVAGAQSADANAGQIEGIVRDTAGKPLRDVFINAISATTMTDSAGHFLLRNVPAGSIMVEGKSVVLGAVGSAFHSVTVAAGQTTVAPLTVRSGIVGHPRPNLLHPSTLLANPGVLMPWFGLLLLFLVYARTDPQSIAGPSIAIAGPVLLFAWPTLIGLWGMVFSNSEENLRGHIGWHAIALVCLGLCQPVVAWWTLARYVAARSLIFLVPLALWSLIWTAYWCLMSAMSIANNWL